MPQPAAAPERSFLVAEVYDTLLAQVGTKRTRQIGSISTRDRLRFANAVGGPELPDTSSDVSLFLTSVMAWDAGAPEAVLSPDGTEPDQLGGLAVSRLRLMGAGQDVEFLRPVLELQDIVQETSVLSVRLKRGSQGDLLVLIEIQHKFQANGEDIVRCTETFIGR